MNRRILEWLEDVYEIEPDRILFTLCYFNHQPPAVLHIVDDDHYDDGEILPFLIDGVIQGETGRKTLHKLMLGQLGYVPPCYAGNPDYTYVPGREYYVHIRT